MIVITIAFVVQNQIGEEEIRPGPAVIVRWRRRCEDRFESGRDDPKKVLKGLHLSMAAASKMDFRNLELEIQFLHHHQIKGIGSEHQPGAGTYEFINFRSTIDLYRETIELQRREAVAEEHKRKKIHATAG